MTAAEQTPGGASDVEACEHGVSWDDECATCDEETALLQTFGAVTPRELGIAERAYRAGQAAAEQRGREQVLSLAYDLDHGVWELLRGQTKTSERADREGQ